MSFVQLDTSFKALSLNAANTACPSATSFANKDEKKTAVVAEYAFANAKTNLLLPPDEQSVDTTELQLDAHVTEVLKRQTFLAAKGNNGLAPPAKQLQTHAKSTPARLCFDSFRECTKIDKVGEGEELHKLLHYNCMMDLLASEYEFLDALTGYISIYAQGQKFQDLLFANLDLRWDGTKYSFQLGAEKCDLNDSENFAFYLRFNKALKEAKNLQEAQHFLKSQQKILERFIHAANPGVKELVNDVVDQLHTLHKKQSSPLLGGLLTKIRWMSRSIKSSTPALPHLLRATCPYFGFFMCDMAERFSTVSGEGEIVGQYNSTRSELMQKQKYLRDIQKGYLDQQVALYKFAYDTIQKRLTDNPKDRSLADFEHRIGDAKKAVFTPAQFEAKIAALKKAIAKLDLAFGEVEKPATELPKAAHAEPASKEKSAAPLSKQKKPKPKKKKPKLKQTINAPATTTTSTAVATLAPAASYSVAAPIQAAAHPQQLAFLSAPVRHSAHARVRRWLTLDPRAFAKIRDFTDTANGAVVQKYKALSDAELKKQHLLHGFTPLVDRILNDEMMRKKYCYTTPTGLGMFVDVRVNGALDNGIKGVLYYGLDKKIYFHRKIDELTMQRVEQLTVSQLVDDSARLVLQNIAQEPTGQELAMMADELSNDFAGDTVTVDDLEVLHFKDNKFKSQISVFPLN